MAERIAAVGVLELRLPLPRPIVFRDWVITERVIAIAAVRSSGGAVGYAYGLTRDGPVDLLLRRHVVPAYLDQPIDDPAAAYHAALGRARPILGSGMGLRALSLVDIATWDVSARVAGRSLRDHVGGTVESLPCMGVVGYPPHLELPDVADQTRTFGALGVGHVKLPMVPGLDANRRRLEAAAECADRVSIDGGWSLHDVAAAVELAQVMPRAGWLEDPVPSERIDLLADVRRAVGVDVAMGDEQGGPGFPDALLLADAVDVVRLDASCAGGITGLRPIVQRVQRAGRGMSFHVFANFHSQIAAALGAADAWIEWSLPGMLVDALTESLPLPTTRDGRMVVPNDHPGLGRLWDPDWLADQQVDDPEGVLGW